MSEQQYTAELVDCEICARARRQQDVDEGPDLFLRGVFTGVVLTCLVFLIVVGTIAASLR